MTARLEHTNYTVADTELTAKWMCEVFGWHIRWQGASIDEGHTIHVGTDAHYLALYSPGKPGKPTDNNYKTIGGLNHIAVVVDDIDAMEVKVRKAGFEPGNYSDYEPGRRFYFDDQDGIEYEVVSYT